MLVLHGGPGLDHTYFRPWLDPLGQDVELVYFDQLGNGRSGEPADWSAVTHATWVASTDALRRSLGVEKVLLFGHSYGGYIALEYALAYPDRVEALILCDTAPAADYGEQTMVNARARATPAQLEVVYSGFSSPVTEDPTVFADMYNTIAPLYFANEIPASVQECFGAMHYRPKAFNRVFFDCRPHFDVIDRLSEIQVPTLILHGVHDWVTPADAGGVRLHTLIRDSELKLFVQSGHFPFIEEHDDFTSTVQTWLRERVHCEKANLNGSAPLIG